MPASVQEELEVVVEEEWAVAEDDDVFCYEAVKVEKVVRRRRALALKRDRQSSEDSNGFGVVVVVASVKLEVKTASVAKTAAAAPPLSAAQLVRRQKWS